MHLCHLEPQLKDSATTLGIIMYAWDDISRLPQLQIDCATALPEYQKRIGIMNALLGPPARGWLPLAAAELLHLIL